MEPERNDMLNIDFIAPDAILTEVKAATKKEVLDALAQGASEQTGRPQREIFNALLQRERLGSTAIGNGIAIPHGKFSGAAGLFGLFCRLSKPVDFAALDGQPIDLAFLLLAPESAGADHLRALSRIARLMRDAALVRQLRAAPDASAIHALLLEPPNARAA